MGKSRSRRAWAVVIPAVAIATVILHGCGSSHPPAAGDGARTIDNVLGGPCGQDGETRSCHAVVAQREGFVDCFDAKQTCEGGQWGPCGGPGGDGTITTHAVSGPGLHIASLSDASTTGAPCSLDPCNPDCHGFNENPPQPILASCGNGGFLIGNILYQNLDGELKTNPQPRGKCVGGSLDDTDCSVTCVGGGRAGRPCRRDDDCEGGSCTGAICPGGTCNGGTCSVDKAGCVGQTNGINDNSTKCDDCNYDMHCVAGSCQPWPLNGQNTSFPADCTSGVDLQVEYPCVMTGDFHITVCNRGVSDAATGLLRLGVFDKDQLRKCADPKGANQPPNGGVFAEADLSVSTIAAGACFEFNSSNTTIKNYPSGTAASLSSFVGQIRDKTAIFANFDASVAECNYCNNANGYQSEVRCTSIGTASSVYTQTYTADCPVGTIPLWGLLGYNVTTPPGTDVKFAVQTGPDVAGPWTPAAPVQVAEASATAPPADHPNACTFSGPSPCGGGYGASCKCPIDLFPALTTPAPLTKPNANQGVLQLSVTMDETVFGCFTGTPTTRSGTSAGCSGGQDSNGTTCTAATQYTDCQQDFHCDVPSGTCVWNQQHTTPAPAVGPNWFDPSCKDDVTGLPGIDLTVGYPCGSTVPLCNRGGGTVPANTSIKLNIANTGTSWDCGAAPSTVAAPGTTDCTFKNSTPIGPGQCVSVDSNSCPGLTFGTGQRQIFVNADLAVKECGMAVAGNGGGCRNNTTNIKATGRGCPPACNAPPTTPVPSLNNWQIEYSCVAGE